MYVIIILNEFVLSDKGRDIMPQIVPMKDLRNTNEISEKCHASNESIFVTKNGYGAPVVISMETYENLVKAADVDTAIAMSEAEIKAGGELLDTKDAFGTLRKKHFG